MIRDYHIFAEPQEKATRPVSVSTSARDRAIWFFNLMAGSASWKRVWVEYNGKSYLSDTMGELP